MMGLQTGDQSRLFYSFNLEGRIPEHHLLRRLNPIVTRVLVERQNPPENCKRVCTPASGRSKTSSLS
jgi:hypothetical protein